MAKRTRDDSEREDECKTCDGTGLVVATVDVRDGSEDIHPCPDCTTDEAEEHDEESSYAFAHLERWEAAS